MAIAAAAIVAGAGAVSGFLGSRSARKAAARKRQRAVDAASVNRLMAILSRIHPILRGQIAATFGPAITQALDRQASLLGPSGAGAATASAAVLAPEVAGFNAALSTSLDLQRQQVAAELGSPLEPTAGGDFAGALAGGTRAFLGFRGAQRAAQEAKLSAASRSARASVFTPAIPPSDFSGTLDPGDEPSLVPSPLLPPSSNR